MTRRSLSVGCVGLLTLLATGCAKKAPRAQLPPPPPSDLIVLMVDPDDGRLGGAVVRAQGAAVELTEDRSATRVVSGGAPSTPSPLAADEIQRLFGEALSARPLRPREFLLYFQAGSDNLTAESQAELPQIVAFVRDRPVPDISVIGHTDTTGDAATNAQLGLRRAALVRDQLVAGGIPTAQIEATSHGEADLLVTTPDNVAEARNRRVEVTIR